LQGNSSDSSASHTTAGLATPRDAFSASQGMPHVNAPSHANAPGPKDIFPRFRLKVQELQQPLSDIFKQ